MESTGTTHDGMTGDPELDAAITSRATATSKVKRARTSGSGALKGSAAYYSAFGSGYLSDAGRALGITSPDALKRFRNRVRATVGHVSRAKNRATFGNKANANKVLADPGVARIVAASKSKGTRKSKSA